MLLKQPIALKLVCIGNIVYIQQICIHPTNQYKSDNFEHNDKGFKYITGNKDDDLIRPL